MVRFLEEIYLDKRWLSADASTAFKVKVVEPCAGNGAISKVLEEELAHSLEITNYDVEPRERVLCRGSISKKDFNHLNVSDDEVIITNPPFSQLDSFINKFHQRKMILLLPVTFRYAKVRTSFIREHLDLCVEFNRQLDLRNWVGGEKALAGMGCYGWHFFNFHDNDDHHFTCEVVDIQEFIMNKEDLSFMNERKVRLNLL